MAILISTNRFPASLFRIGIAAWSIATSAILGWAQPAEPDYKIKAVFLYNFTQFVVWPETAFGDPRSPLTVGVLGDDPFGPQLDETVRGEKVNGRGLVVRRFRLVEEIGLCHVLFISRSETARLHAIFQALAGRSILIVGEAENFAREGGMVQFVTERGRIRLRVNVDAAKAARLTISSKLLRAAEVVTSEKN